MSVNRVTPGSRLHLRKWMPSLSTFICNQLGDLAMENVAKTVRKSISEILNSNNFYLNEVTAYSRLPAFNCDAFSSDNLRWIRFARKKNKEYYFYVNCVSFCARKLLNPDSFPWLSEMYNFRVHLARFLKLGNSCCILCRIFKGTALQTQTDARRILGNVHEIWFGFRMEID